MEPDEEEWPEPEPLLPPPLPVVAPPAPPPLPPAGMLPLIMAASPGVGTEAAMRVLPTAMRCEAAGMGAAAEAGL